MIAYNAYRVWNDNEVVDVILMACCFDIDEKGPILCFSCWPFLFALNHFR